MEMKPFVRRNYGSVTCAYWAPADCGLGFVEAAEAALDLDGVARVFAWRDILRQNPHARRPSEMWDVIGREHTGSTADELERGKSLDPAIRVALEAAIMDALMAAQRASKVQTDDNGNFAE